MNTNFQRIAVVGAGQMGAGIAQVFAAKGCQVSLIDTKDEFVARGVESIRGSLARIVKKGGIAQAEADATLARVAGSTGYDAAARCELAIEAIVEDEGIKKACFAKLDAIAPAGAILASNTSSISITVLAAATRRPRQVAGMHFMNPVPLMQLVEVIRGQETSDETAARIVAAVEMLGKTAVEARDFPGFVSNRILMPMINEAIYALMEGLLARRHRHRDEARDEPPDGAAAARRLHRPRYLPFDPGGSPRRLRRSQVSPLPAPAADGGGRIVGKEGGARLLRLVVGAADIDTNDRGTRRDLSVVSVRVISARVTSARGAMPSYLRAGRDAQPRWRCGIR